MKWKYCSWNSIIETLWAISSLATQWCRKYTRNMKNYTVRQKVYYNDEYETLSSFNIMSTFKNRLAYCLTNTLVGFVKVTKHRFNENKLKKIIFYVFTWSLGSMVKLPEVGFIQATYWQLWISFKVSLLRSYLQSTHSNGCTFEININNK